MLYENNKIFFWIYNNFNIFFIFKIIDYKNTSNLGEIIEKKLGPLFRSKSKIQDNLKISNIGNSEDEKYNHKKYWVIMEEYYQNMFF